jgi:hypothetical protein
MGQCTCMRLFAKKNSCMRHEIVAWLGLAQIARAHAAWKAIRRSDSFLMFFSGRVFVSEFAHLPAKVIPSMMLFYNRTCMHIKQY